MKIIAFDLETTGTDSATCEVCQIGGIAIDTEADPRWENGETRSMLCSTLKPIPAEATEVHGITDAMVAGKPHFRQIAEDVITWLNSADVLVTFNGLRYDCPIIARHTPGRFTGSWRHPHVIDGWRMWQRLRLSNDTEPPTNRDHNFPPAAMAGSLTSAHWWLLGRGFDGAHEATADCQATLEVVWSMTHCGHDHDEGIAYYDRRDEMTLQEWADICSLPLPGDVDFEGKIKLNAAGQAVFGFGKHKGERVSLHAQNRGYVRWMLDADFPEGTKRVLRDVVAGKIQ